MSYPFSLSFSLSLTGGNGATFLKGAFFYQHIYLQMTTSPILSSSQANISKTATHPLKQGKHIVEQTYPSSSHPTSKHLQDNNSTTQTREAHCRTDLSQLSSSHKQTPTGQQLSHSNSEACYGTDSSQFLILALFS